MDADIENIVGECKNYNQSQNNPPRLEPHSWEEPTVPLHRLHIDFFGPISGNYLLIVVYAISKWQEVFPTENTTSGW